MQLSRRRFLKLLGASGATLSQAAALQQVLASSEPGSFQPVSIAEREPYMHVISRLTFGPTNELINHVRSISPEAYIEEQLSPEIVDDSSIEPYLNYFPDLGKSAAEILTEYQDQVFRVTPQLTGNWIMRAMYSQRQLYERMVHFWSDHFSIFASNSIMVVLKIVDDRDVIRQHAMGRFRDLLGASAHSAAMLVYLDNAESDQRAPNENYARELMELHTLGVDGGYTETDVKEVARCFTGWTIARPRNRTGINAEAGMFLFVPRMHDDGDKQVLGQLIPAGGGELDGELVLDMLASHPATARYVSTKLVRRFVSDNPPDALVEACTQTFLNTDGDIRSVLRTMFSSQEFWNAPPKFKRPFEYTMSALRGLNYDIQEPEPFGRAFQAVMSNMGHMPFQRPTPDGYPDVQEEWTDNLLTRWNIAIAAAHGGVPGATASIRPVLEANNVPLEPEPIVDFMSNYLYGRALTTDESQVISDYLAGGTDVERLQDVLALLLAAPAFQYR